MLHYDAILFDVDGTLIDSAPGILHTLEEVFQKMGVDVTGVNLRRYLGPPLRKSFGEHFTEVVTPILEEKGLAPFFDFIGGASMDESRDTKTDVVHYVLSQPMLQGKRVLMVGDRNDDMRGAADCGLDAAGALYGYGSREELVPFHPVLLAESCADLADQLLEQRA